MVVEGTLPEWTLVERLTTEKKKVLEGLVTLVERLTNGKKKVLEGIVAEDTVKKKIKLIYF